MFGWWQRHARSNRLMCNEDLLQGAIARKPFSVHSIINHRVYVRLKTLRLASMQ